MATIDRSTRATRNSTIDLRAFRIPAWGGLHVLRSRALRRVGATLAGLVAASSFGCTDGGGGGDGFADNGGMSGTGISQGVITAFGSIFVNATEWDVSGATIEIDDQPASENDLRVGMVVEVEGDFTAGNAFGTAIRVRFEDVIEGPIDAAPVVTVPGSVKIFTILGQTVTVDVAETVYDGGASFAGLAADDVLEVSGFPDGSGGVQATRVALRGVFPGDDEIEIAGIVTNHLANSDGTGTFDLGPIVVRYVASTTFEGVTREALANGERVDIDGVLRVTGNEVDATRIELESEGLGDGDRARVEVEGIANACAETPDFCVNGIPIDASMAMIQPIGFTPMVGDRLEIEGPLVGGTLEAERIRSEEEEEPSVRNVRLEGAVTSVDAGARTLVILGLTVAANGDTRIEDDSSQEDESFRFEEIQPGDYLEIRGVDEGGATIRARSIERNDATAGEDDVMIQGPVTDLDPLVPRLEILGLVIPLDGGTLYLDATGTPRSEDQFFRNPGDVMLGDLVKAEDRDAVDLATLGEADEVEIGEE